LARGPRYNVPYRRRRDRKTDYEKRKSLILSNAPRLVVRTTNKHTIVQVTEAKTEGDKILATATSIELKEKFNWKGGCGNTPAAYLTGMLAGFKALEKKVNRAVPDIGLRKASPGAKVFAALKGALDSKLNMPCNEKVLPDESRIRGDHIANYAKQVSSNQALYNRHFSQYIARKLSPENLPNHFNETKEKIVEQYAKTGVSK